MSKQKFCDKVDSFIKDEQSAQIKYHDFLNKNKDILANFINFEHQLKHLSMDEGSHKRFWEEVKTKVCRRQ